MTPLSDAALRELIEKARNAGPPTISAEEQVALERGECIRCGHASHRGQVCEHRVIDAAGSPDWCGCAWRMVKSTEVDHDVILALLTELQQARVLARKVRQVDPVIDLGGSGDDSDWTQCDWCGRHSRNAPVLHDDQCIYMLARQIGGE